MTPAPRLYKHTTSLSRIILAILQPTIRNLSIALSLSSMMGHGGYYAALHTMYYA
jgi:hypothetical protein